MNAERILVFGGHSGIGAAVKAEALEYDYKVETAGIDEAEDHRVDVSNGAQVVALFRRTGPFDHVVVCTGRNVPTSVGSIGLQRQMHDMMDVNYFGPIAALQAWLKQRKDWSRNGHFVAVSSNSAHIARSKSLGYCASKAALSMAIRCAAREVAEVRATVWGVEPGWVEGTPMSLEVERHLSKQNPAPPPHRIPGGRSQQAQQVAEMIIFGIRADKQAWNGCMFRMDGGEQ